MDTELDYWLGQSQDGRVWGLAATPSGVEEGDYPQPEVLLLLLDPPKHQPGAISSILFRVCFAGKEESVEDILCSAPFKSYRSVRDFLPGLPASWLDLPATLSIRFEVSENGGVGPDTFEEYYRNSLAGAMRVLTEERLWGVLVGYSLSVQEVVPFMGWNVDWPLSRRGRDRPTRREKEQGVAPWEREDNSTLFTVYQVTRRVGYGLQPHCCADTSLRLEVGGRTPEEAIENWHQCARLLRRVKRGLG
ncbi:MAG: hypothetical protein U5S82_13680 [Gammaproteobacteria bacterium]|nr:hypothetical protein [Gammaproteobacteria bacterium]